MKNSLILFLALTFSSCDLLGQSMFMPHNKQDCPDKDMCVLIESETITHGCTGCAYSYSGLLEPTNIIDAYALAVYYTECSVGDAITTVTYGLSRIPGGIPPDALYSFANKCSKADIPDGFYGLVYYYDSTYMLFGVQIENSEIVAWASDCIS